MATRYMERNKVCKCQYCHASFEAVRYDAKFCSPKCRVAYKRFLDSINDLEHDLDRLVDKLGAYFHTVNQGAAAHVARKTANRLRYVAEKMEDE